MTSYVVSAELAHGKIQLDDPVFISERAWRSGGAGTDGSTSFLQLNSKVALKDLLYGMIIQSGNDAAIALAEHVAGSEADLRRPDEPVRGAARHDRHPLRRRQRPAERGPLHDRARHRAACRAR